MPIFPQKARLEVLWEKDSLVAEEAWILFEIQGASYIRSHSVPLAIEATTSTEKDQINHIKYTLVHL